MPFTKKNIVILLVLGLVIALDHITKGIAIYYLKDTGQVYSFWGDLFRLQYAENSGAFLSLGANLPEALRSMIMTGLNAVILAALLLYLILRKKISLLLLYGLSMIVAGGLGNLIDRVVRGGHVVDFMNMGITTNTFMLRTGIFNVAELAIMAGLFLVVLNEVLEIRQKKKTALKEVQQKK